MKSAITPERHSTVPKIFRGIPTIPRYPAPGPVKQLMKDINYIKSLDTIPCAPASWQVIVETGVETAGAALLTLFLPGCNDIAKTKLGLSPWHARGIKGMIQKAVPPQAINATKFLYKIGYFTAEKYLWFFQVAEVTKEFFITWQSAVYMQQQCELPTAGTAYGYITPFVYSGTFTGPLAISPQKLVPGIACGLSDVAIAPGFQGSFSWTVEWDTYPIRGGGVNVSTWQTEDGSEDVFNLSTTYNPATGQKNTTAGHLWAKNDSTSAQRHFRLWMAANSDVNVQAVSGTWTFSSQGRHAGLYSFGCLPKSVPWPFPNPFGL